MNDRSKKPVLKLAFAMGGGVSLGAFSGSALTEAIKLALLRIVEGNAPYRKVVVDVFSGASAGSLSLAVMLRGFTWRESWREVEAEKSLQEQLGSSEWRRIKREHAEIAQDLIVTQVTQDLQNEAWVQRINLDELLGGDDPVRKEALRWSPGLLDSEAVYRIARKLLLMPEIARGKRGRVDLGGRRLLAERCLFGCTLTSLTSFVQDATGTFNTSRGSAAGLRDAFRSKVHKDLRIFDIKFSRLDPSVLERSRAAENALHGAFKQMARVMEEEMKRAIEDKGTDFDKVREIVTGIAEQQGPEYMSRWYRLHDGPSKSGFAGDIKGANAWTSIAAAAIASGAFPGAFAPAILKRYIWEYDKGQWPKGLGKEASNNEHASHPFAYVDGGVFNNDPIREAFRMASFMDAHYPEEGGSIRRLIYVDPSVSPEIPKLRVSTLREIGEDELSLFNLASPKADSPKSSLSRIFSLLGGVVGTLVDQGRSREADGQAKTRNNFELRDRFRDTMARIADTLNCGDLAENLYQRLVVGCGYCLDRLHGEMIPPGEGSLQGELKRVLRETKDQLPGLKLELAGTYLAYGPRHDDIKALGGQWLAAHLCLYLDLMLGLEGKNAETEIIAITPYTFGKSDDAPKPVKLLGDPLAAFAGFMSLEARQFDFDMGKHCAAVFLELDKRHPRVREEARPLLPDNTSWHARMPQRPCRMLLRKQFVRGLLQLKDRVEQVARDGLGLVASLALPLVEWLNNVNRLIDENVDATIASLYDDEHDEPLVPTVSVEIAILLPDDLSLKLDALGLFDHDAKARELNRLGPEKPNDGRWPMRALFTGAHFVREFVDGKPSHTGRWEGSAVHRHRYLTLQRTGMHFGSWGHIPLPSSEWLESQRPMIDTQLRPVMVLDLTQDALVANGRLAEEGKLMKHWKFAEMAVPLYERLMLEPHSDEPDGGRPGKSELKPSSVFSTSRV